MLVVTWNVNSVRPRLDRLLAFLRRHQPDAVCLQELKCQDPEFPLVEVQAAGYHAAVLGQKTYNGVAILSKEAPAEVQRGFGDGEDDPQARFLAATIGGVRVCSMYVPNGQEVGSPAFQYKLRWLDRLRAYVERHHRPTDPVLLCGDYNIAPADRDVYDPIEWRDQTLCHPEERARFEALCALGFHDTLREQHPEGSGPYTWWDYRMLAFPKNRGLRIDHILATAPLAARCTAAAVDREERKSNKQNKDDKPSDHAPVLVTFDLAAPARAHTPTT